MNIVVDIGHPAHVHLFRHFIHEARARGHTVWVTAADKDIAHQLLEAYGLDYIKLGSTGRSLMQKVLSVAALDYALFKAVRDLKPDVLVGHTSIRCAHVARWLKAKSVIFADTEATIREHMLYRPFADWIISPESFERHFGDKHIRYAGYHELAYLHPSRFRPDKEKLKQLGLAQGQRFFILRFISWDATHDIGHRGFSYEGKVKLINRLKEHGRVLISSEEKLPMEFQKYHFDAPLEDMHDILAFAGLCVSEGATMCSEAAMLGVPSFLVSTLVHGYIKELDERYGLVNVCEDEGTALESVGALLAEPERQKEWQHKKDVMLKDKIDLTEWFMNFIARNIQPNMQIKETIQP